MFPGARDKWQGLARHLCHREDEAQKGIRTYLMLHSEAAFRRGVGIEESRQEGFLWSEKSDNDPENPGSTELGLAGL